MMGLAVVCCLLSDVGVSRDDDLRETGSDHLWAGKSHGPHNSRRI
jgi:hypothetical protein